MHHRIEKTFKENWSRIAVHSQLNEKFEILYLCRCGASLQPIFPSLLLSVRSFALLSAVVLSFQGRIQSKFWRWGAFPCRAFEIRAHLKLGGALLEGGAENTNTKIIKYKCKTRLKIIGALLENIMGRFFTSGGKTTGKKDGAQKTGENVPN